MPTTDSFAVVRCKECKHFCCFRVCEVFKRQMEENDYCSYGERRTNCIQTNLVGESPLNVSGVSPDIW